MKGSGNYLRNQVRKNLVISLFCLFLFVLVFFVLFFRLFSTLRVGVIEGVLFLVALIPLAGFYFFSRKYQIYRGGWEGEKRVTDLLSSSLGDDFFLLNNLYFHDGGGDIDHLVLGSKAVFVLETKNWSGEITCNGDEWQRVGKRLYGGSPSVQVKKNVAKIRRIINSSKTLSSSGTNVEGILVFTNNNSNLHLNNPTVLVVKLSELPNTITSFRSSSNFSRPQLETIGKEILKRE